MSNKIIAASGDICAAAAAGLSGKLPNNALSIRTGSKKFEDSFAHKVIDLYFVLLVSTIIELNVVNDRPQLNDLTFKSLTAKMIGGFLKSI